MPPRTLSLVSALALALMAAKKNKERIEGLFERGGSALADVLGIGGCWDIVKELT